MKPACLRGHLFTESNTQWNIGRDGYAHRQCKQCKVARTKLKYRNDDAYRERTKAQGRAWRARKAARPEVQAE